MELLPLVLRRVTEPPVLAWAAAGLSTLFALGFAVYLATRTLPGGGVQPGTGDYLAFYTGATMVHEGRGGDLYDLAAQQQLQTAILGGPSEAFQGYLHPPGFAIALAPAVGLGFQGSFVLFGLAMATGFGAGARMVRPHLPHLAGHRTAAWTTLGVVATYQPVATAMWGGQLSAWVLGVIGVVYGAVRSGNDVVAGLAVGVLSIKPQYALPLGLGLLVWRRWSAAGIAVVCGVGHLLLGVAVCGPRWPLAMAAALRIYDQWEQTAELTMHTSIRWFFASLLPEGAGVATVVADLVVVAIVVAGLRGAAPGTRAFTPAFGLLVTGAMLVSPHLFYYDLAILALPVVLALDRVSAERGDVPLPLRLAVLAGWMGFTVFKLGDLLSFQPLFFELAAVFAWMAHQRFGVRGGRPGGPPPGRFGAAPEGVSRP